VRWGLSLSDAWNEVERMPRQFEPSNRTVAALEASRDESGRLGPKAEVVDGTTFDFGSGQRNGKGKHTFVIRNLGDEPLTLSRGATSCKCAVSELKNDKIGPGESTDVTLEWHLTTEGEQFRQTADIYTNDPRQPTITLVVQVHGKRLGEDRAARVGIEQYLGQRRHSSQFSLYGFQVEQMAVVESPLREFRDG
jgi:hypothetical protein